MGHHWDKVPPRGHGGSTGDDRDARLPRGARKMSGKSVGVPPMTSRLRGGSERSTLCEMVAVEPGRGLSCPQGHVPGVLQELLGMEPALVSKAASSILTQSRGPETPAIPHAVPEAPRLRLGTGHPATGATSPPLPPSPRPRRASGSLAGTCSEQPRAQTRRSPRGGDFGKPVAPGGRAAKRSGRCHTRQQSSHSAECHTTDGDMQRDTAQSDRPTAQPDAEVSEAPARADTFAHLDTAGFRGSNLEIFSGYVRAAKNTSLNQGWVFNNLLFGAFSSLF